MARKPTEIGIARTAPEAAALPVERTVDSSGRQAAPQPAARRTRAAALTMLIAGGLLVAIALVAVGNRVNASVTVARELGSDPVAAFFLGAGEPSVGHALVTIGLLALIPVGIVLGAIGYRRITDDGPAMASMHVSSSPNGVISSAREGLGG